jgi:hypothetical protein
MHIFIILLKFSVAWRCGPPPPSHFTTRKQPHVLLLPRFLDSFEMSATTTVRTLRVTNIELDIIVI